MSHYKHLTPEEREIILVLYSYHCNIQYIANCIDRDRSTIYRELKRNTIHKYYSATAAQAAYEHRRLKCRPKKKLSDPETYEEVKKLFLDHQWSPEEISGRIALEKPELSVSYTTIYRGIYSGLFNAELADGSDGIRSAKRKLRHKGKTRRRSNQAEKRGKIIISHDIDERPQAANDRSRIGDWEGDTVIGKRDGQCLVTLADRMSRFLLCRKAENKDSNYVTDVMVNCLNGQPLHTITPDRGKEFARHADVSAVLNNVQFYFPQPGQPWQRGTNENTNGLLREYFPKGTDLSKYSDDYIQSKVDELNKRPRKCLGYLTPYEVYFSTVLHLV